MSTALARLLLLAAVTTLLACNPPLTEEELTTRTRQAIADRDMAAADVDVRSLLRQNPNNAEARELYGQVLLFQQDFPAAIDQFERAIAAGAGESAMLRLARALVAANRPQELLEQARAGRFDAVKGSPEFQAAVIRAHIAAGQTEAAQAGADLLSDSPEPYVDATRAVMLFALEQQPEAALELLQATLERHPDSDDTWSLLGLLAIRSADWELAARSLEKATAINPYRIMERLELVNALIRLDKREEADRLLSTLAKQIPDAPQLALLRGRRFYDDGDYENAIDQLSRVLTAQPDNPAALILSANANLQENNRETALWQLNRYVSLNPGDLGAGLQLGNLLMSAGQSQRVEEVARGLLEEHEMDVRVLRMLAVALAAQGHHAESASTYEQLATLLPESQDIRADLATQQLKAGNTEYAIAELRRAVETSPEDATAQEMLVTGLMTAGNSGEALEAAIRYQKAFPDSLRANMLLGHVHLTRRDLAAARAAYETAFEMEGGAGVASSGLSTVALLEGDLEAAENAFRRALEVIPGDLDTSMNLAKLYEKQGKLEQMKATLETARDANPDAPAPRLELARLALASSQPDVAIAQLIAVKEAAPENAELRRQLATAYLQSGRLEDASSSARELLRLAPDDPGALTLAARIEMAGGRRDPAQQYLKDALELEPRNVEARLALIQVLSELGRTDEASTQIAALPASVQDRAGVLRFRGRLAFSSGDYGTAVSLFEQLFEQQPDSVNLLLLSGAQWENGEKRAALERLEQWLEEFPEDAPTGAELALRYMQLGRTREAVDRYLTVVEQQPANALALNNLAWLLREDDTEAALAYIQQAEAVAPQNARVKDTYAIIEMQRGRFEEALRLSRQASDIEPDNLDLRYHRARILSAAGQTEEAIKLLEALVSDPAFASQAEAGALLAQLKGS
jgi:putative PEP-CTERM system TPR-repeat lipoprotein